MGESAGARSPVDLPGSPVMLGCTRRRLMAPFRRTARLNRRTHTHARTQSSPLAVGRTNQLPVAGAPVQSDLAASIYGVARRRGRLVPGWVTFIRLANHLGM